MNEDLSHVSESKAPKIPPPLPDGDFIHLLRLVSVFKDRARDTVAHRPVPRPSSHGSLYACPHRDLDHSPDSIFAPPPSVD